MHNQSLNITQPITPYGNLERKLNGVSSLRKMYAWSSYGNACSEQNHCSVLSSINPGVEKDRDMCCEHPIKLIRDFLKRQKEQTRPPNFMLEGMQQKSELN